MHASILIYVALRFALARHANADDGDHPVFGAPLHESLRYASVQISTANANGELYVWGYIPVVVAKWCVRAPPASCVDVNTPPQRAVSQGEW